MVQDKFTKFYDYDCRLHMAGHAVAHDRLDLVIREIKRRCVSRGKRILGIGISDGYDRNSEMLKNEWPSVGYHAL